MGDVRPAAGLALLLFVDFHLEVKAGEELEELDTGHRSVGDKDVRVVATGGAFPLFRSKILETLYAVTALAYTNFDLVAAVEVVINGN